MNPKKKLHETNLWEKDEPCASKTKYRFVTGNHFFLAFFFFLGISQFFLHEIILKIHLTFHNFKLSESKAPSQTVCRWLQCHTQIMSRCSERVFKLSQAETASWKPFHMQRGKWMEECLMAFYTTVRYRPEWESRSSASQGAALQRRRMASALKCTASSCDRG